MLARHEMTIVSGNEMIFINKQPTYMLWSILHYFLTAFCHSPVGGPLHLGDIEEIGGAGHPCVVCPWHSWKYSLLSGELRAPAKRGLRVGVYPVRVEPGGNLSVGFQSFSTDFFNGAEDF